MERGELQPLLDAPCQGIDRGWLDILGVFGQMGVHQSLGVFLSPAEALTDEQTFITDRHVLAGHGVVGRRRILRRYRNTTNACLRRTYPRIKSQRRKPFQIRESVQSPGRKNTDQCCSGADTDRVKLDGRTEQCLNGERTGHGWSLLSLSGFQWELFVQLLAYL